MRFPHAQARSPRAELMDAPDLGFDAFDACLSDLERINIATQAYRPALAFLDRLRERLPKGRTLTVLDAGCGGGDMLRRIALWAGKRRQAVALYGVDRNPWAVQSAARRTPAALNVSYHVSDIFAYRPERHPDVIISSLFTHHLTDEDIIRFLHWMEERARYGWFVSDLHRHPLPYHFIYRTTRLLRLNRIVRHDAPLSVARGFTAAEWRRFLAEADIPAAETRLRWHFPFRYGISRFRQGRRS